VEYEYSLNRKKNSKLKINGQKMYLKYRTSKQKEYSSKTHTSNMDAHKHRQRDRIINNNNFMLLAFWYTT